MDKSLRSFLYPCARYHGPVKPEQLVFNANLQEFAQRVGYVSNLHTGGKLSSGEAFEEICQLWHDLKCSKEYLHIGRSEGEA